MTHLAGRAGKVLFLSVLTAMLLAATAFAADIATGAGTTTGSSLRLRSEPSTSASVVTMLDKDVTVALQDGSVDGWYKVSYNTVEGYMSAEYLEVSAAAEVISRVVPAERRLIRLASSVSRRALNSWVADR